MPSDLPETYILWLDFAKLAFCSTLIAQTKEVGIAMTQLSTRRVVIVFVLVMCISLTTNVFLLQKIHKQGEPVVTPPTFYQLIDSINENFSYTGYNEILNQSNLFMALPQ